MFTLGLRKYSREPTYQVIISRFPSLRIPRLELENPRWNTYVDHALQQIANNILKSRNLLANYILRF